MLKRYNQFLATQNIITRDQLIQINHIKYRTLQRVPKFYSYDYLKKIYLIIVNSNNFTDDERLFIFLILNHAATFTEILSIEITNIDWEKRTIHIQTPTRERMLLLQKEDLLYLTRYILAKRNQIDVKQSFKLFQTNGKPYTRKNIIVALEKVSKYFEVRIGFTELRNTFIMYLIDIGMNPIYIKEYLGLKSFTSINRFKFVNHTFIKEVQQLINTMRSVPKFKTHNDNVIRNIFEEHYQENKLTHHLEYKEEEQ